MESQMQEQEMTLKDSKVNNSKKISRLDDDVLRIEIDDTSTAESKTEIPNFNPEMDAASINSAAESAASQSNSDRDKVLKNQVSIHIANALSLFESVMRPTFMAIENAKRSLQLLLKQRKYLSSNMRNTQMYNGEVKQKDHISWSLHSRVTLTSTIIIGLIFTGAGIYNVATIASNTAAYVNNSIGTLIFALFFLAPAITFHAIFSLAPTFEKKRRILHLAGIFGLIFFGIFITIFAYQNYSQLTLSSKVVNLIADEVLVNPVDELLSRIGFIAQLISDGLLGSTCFMFAAFYALQHGGRRNVEVPVLNPQYQAYQDQIDEIDRKIAMLQETINLATICNNIKKAKLNKLTADVTNRFYLSLHKYERELR